MASLRCVRSSELGGAELHAVRQLMDEAFEGDFADTDWENSLGGMHVIVEEGDLVLAHASVVPRALRIGERPVSTGYVEAVATRPNRQRRGHATAALEEVSRLILESFEMGALSTGVPSLYERLGWELWQGPTFASTPTGIARTSDDDGGVMVLRTPATDAVDLGAPLTCDWRAGDVW